MARPEPREDFDAMARISRDPRSREQIEEHYLLERRLADRLRVDDPGARKVAYPQAYQELFASLPHHPQNNNNFRGSDYIGGQSALLRRMVPRGAVFVEVGAGDARLAVDMAPHCSEVVAIDITDALFDRASAPANVAFRLTDGIRMDCPDDSVDFVYSNQLMEHLHPDDARAQLAEIHRILRPGGSYFCITPNAASGPHDVSKYFDHRATGFHLKEYSYSSLAREMRRAGFREASPVLVRKGRFQRVPLPVTRLLELGVEGVQRATGRSLRSNGKIRALLGINMVATK